MCKETKYYNGSEEVSKVEDSTHAIATEILTREEMAQRYPDYLPQSELTTIKTEKI